LALQLAVFASMLNPGEIKLAHSLGVMNVKILRFLALVLGSIWFFPVSCTTGIIAGTLMIARLDSRDIEKGEQPHPWFFVVARPAEAESPFTVIELKDLPKSGSATHHHSFLMPRPSDGIRTNEYTQVSYRVLSDRGTGQTIEVEYSDDDKTIWSRYRATPSDVVPLFSRMSHPGYMFRALPIGFIFALLVYGVGRFLRRRHLCAAQESIASPTAPSAK
jgi:hypothetical protein